MGDRCNGHYEVSDTDRLPIAGCLHLHNQDNKRERRVLECSSVRQCAREGPNAENMGEEVYTVENFAGVWKRTELFEPKGTPGPEQEQEKDVIWLQGADGYFIDIRHKPGATKYFKMKSFAGIGSFDQVTGQFTWTRVFDFRLPGTPDVGLMLVSKGTLDAPEQLVEDSVLPGDDFREVWDRISPPHPTTDCTAKLRQVTADGTIAREGLFMVVGDWFALTIARPAREDGEDALKAAFSDKAEESKAFMQDEANRLYLWSYTAAMGKRASWEITHSLQPELRGRMLGLDLASAGASTVVAMAFDGLFDSVTGNWEWEFITGKPPLSLVAFMRVA